MFKIVIIQITNKFKFPEKSDVHTNVTREIALGGGRLFPAILRSFAQLSIDLLVSEDTVNKLIPVFS